MKSISEEITALREMNVVDLVERYEAVFGRPPRSRHQTWLWRRIAWRIQADRFGGLSTVAQRKLDELIADLDLPIGNGHSVRGTIERATQPGMPQVGTTITRVWRGKELLVRVVDGGYEYQNVRYRSLSAVANAITNSHVSGRAFFGLTERKVAK